MWNGHLYLKCFSLFWISITSNISVVHHIWTFFLKYPKAIATFYCESKNSILNPLLAHNSCGINLSAIIWTCTLNETNVFDCRDQKFYSHIKYLHIFGRIYWQATNLTSVSFHIKMMTFDIPHLTQSICLLRYFHIPIKKFKMNSIVHCIQLKSTTFILNLHKCSDPFAFIMSNVHFIIVITRLVYSLVSWIFVGLLSCCRIAIAVIVNIMCQFFCHIDFTFLLHFGTHTVSAVRRL